MDGSTIAEDGDDNANCKINEKNDERPSKRDFSRA
jgi:hypothetical protein